ncbi:Ribonuclease P/MRP subunit POP1 with POPLD domain [Cryptosporidium felis]|nr:Ribonuclease P/MRP subunit POP1 with POPLD domain [Cryptosporidium felis]
MQSKTEIHQNSLINGDVGDSIPQIINVPHLAQGRKDELSRYIEFVQKSNSTKRSFQKLPPVMRRRSMSYNIYRAPRRIRTRLLFEMSKAPPRISKKKRKKKKKLPWIKRNLLSRAINKNNFFGMETLPLKVRNITELSDIFRQKQRKIGSELPFNQFRWLESHLYHSKRFQMCEGFGYKLPLHSTLKRNRKIFRAFKNGCIVHDASYLHLFELKGSDPDILLLFKVSNFNVNFLFSPEYIAGNLRGGGFLFKININKFNFLREEVDFIELPFYHWERIAPIEFLWVPSCKSCGSDRSLWVWIHPIASYELFVYWENCIELLNLNINISFIEDVNRFEFLGKRSLDFINLLTYPQKKNELKRNVVQDLINAFDLIFPLTLSTINKYLSCQVSVITNKSQNLPKSNDSSTHCSFFCISYRQLKRENYNLIKNSSPHNSFSFNSCTRSKRRQDIKTLLAKIVERNKTLKISISNKKYGKTDTLQENKFVVSKVLIIFHQGTNLGFDLIFPRGLNSSLLLRFIQSRSAQIIGIGERRKLNIELGIPSFPYDYIETLSNQKIQITNPVTSKSKNYLNELCNEIINLSNYLRTPPSKRVNYLFNKIEFPFLVNWDKILNIESVSSSTFQNNYMILNKLISKKLNILDEVIHLRNFNLSIPRLGYRGTKREINQIFSCSANLEGKSGFFVLVKIISTRKINYKAHIYMCEREDITLINEKKLLSERPHNCGKTNRKENIYSVRFNNEFITSRRLVGVVTSGGYSMQLGKGIGIGYISSNSLTNSLCDRNGEPQYFWIRNNALKFLPVKVVKFDLEHQHFSIY